MEKYYFSTQKEAKHFYLISYDISNDKQRTRVSRCLEGYGKRVQYSVFECWITNSQLNRIKSKLYDILDKKDCQAIRIYKIDNSVGYNEDEKSLMYNLVIC